ncbi:hypothetical protein BDN72DRAFT_848900 [Pluteus cervinus]|uniref:Uncharacterized protein n=1 Tax=Pluteus cervinus TaxID=181527 RepID=A0ACD3A9Z4_9AGAR|nr:hypothetical protein BDN72DRAFT_848900 [Pluteus cervinus]
MTKRHYCLIYLAFLFTLTSTSPITSPENSESPPPKKPLVLSPGYHAFFNLIWASLTAYEAYISLRVFKLPLDQKTKESFTFISGAIFARCVSHILTIAFAVLVLPHRKSTGSESSILGTFADLAAWVVDPLLLAAVFRSIHSQPLTHFTTTFTHDTFDRVLLGSFMASIFALTIVSYAHPGPFPSGYDLLKTIYSIYLAISLVLIIDCVVRGVILAIRQKRKGVTYPPLAYSASFEGILLFGISSLRFLSAEQIQPPFVLDFINHILLHAILYSFTFCAMIIVIAGRKESGIAVRMFICAGVTLLLLYYILYMFYRLNPR